MKREIPLTVALAFLTSAPTSWASPSSRPLNQPRLYAKRDFGREMNGLVFSPKGSVMYVATSRGLFMKGTLTGKTLATYWAPKGWSDFGEVQISPNGRDLVAVAFQGQNPRIYEGRLFVWDVYTQRLKAIVKTNSGGGMAFSPDGHWLARGEGYYEAKLRLINAHDWKSNRKLLLKGPKPPWHLAFSKDSRRLVGTANYGDAGIADLTVWDIRSGRLLTYSDNDISMGSPVYFLPSSPHGKRLVADGMTFTTSNSPHSDDIYTPGETEEHIRKRIKSKPIFNEVGIRLVAFPYRGNLFVVESSYGKLELWDVLRRKRMAIWNVLLSNKQHMDATQHYICSSDGRWLAVWSGQRSEVTLYQIKPSV